MSRPLVFFIDLKKDFQVWKNLHLFCWSHDGERKKWSITFWNDYSSQGKYFWELKGFHLFFIKSKLNAFSLLLVGWLSPFSYPKSRTRRLKTKDFGILNLLRVQWLSPWQWYSFEVLWQPIKNPSQRWYNGHQNNLT